MLINQYKDGERDGYWELYHSNGELMFKGTYKNGIQDGSWEWYHDNGELWYKGTFNNGKEIGYWIEDDKEKFYVN